MSRVIPNAFARGVMENALAELRDRLAKIQPLIAEAAGLEKAIAAQEAALRKVPAANGSAPALPPARTEAEAGRDEHAAIPVSRDRGIVPARSGPRPTRHADPELGSIKQQLYKLLSHEQARRGVASAVLARAVKGAQASSVIAQLSTLSNDEAEGIIKIGRGFYKLKPGWTVDDDGTAHRPTD
ncbi:MAG: hypothetical protein ABW167_07550 [Baekduia sp.]